MHISNLNDPAVPDTDFMYTADDSFSEVLGRAEAGTVTQPANPTVLRFREKNGSIWMTAESTSGDETFGFLSTPETTLHSRSGKTRSARRCRRHGISGTAGGIISAMNVRPLLPTPRKSA